MDRISPKWVEDLLSALSALDGVSLRGPRRGRFREEVNVDLVLGGRRVATLKIFFGRKPYYGPWIEVFDVDAGFYGSSMEGEVYRIIHRHVPCGTVVYVEYVNDSDTRSQLFRGEDPSLSRLGLALRGAGMRVVKDWYFPEGWLEGAPKLQAVKDCA